MSASMMVPGFLKGRSARVERLAPLLIGLLVLLAFVAAVAAGMFKRSVAPAPGKRALAGPPLGAPPPPVEPLVLRDVAPAEARSLNAAVPFITGPKPSLRPFVHPGPAADRELARTCLARAAWYEAGDDRVGQQAVVQVVLNRLRHPAFPKTVCGVVNQGSDRTTGCQFSFTCDGSTARVPPPDPWRRALNVAEAALSGFVMKQVGTATHYHTDWVVPYWSASLDKLTEVHTHLFFRWRGAWGLPGAFRGRYKRPETPVDPAEAAEAADVAKDAEDAALLAGEANANAAPSGTGLLERMPPPAARGATVRLKDEASGDYVLALDPAAFPGDYAIAALRVCRDKPVCTVTGWLDAAKMPSKLPVAGEVARSASFVFRRRSGAGNEQALWNCSQIARPDRSQCMPEEP